EWCPAGELVREAMASTDAALSGFQWIVDVREDDLVWCDARLVTQALGNLVLNATQHVPPGSPVTIRIQTVPHEWRLEVRDRGPGLPPGREAEVFRKFHRYGDHSRGTGLGLAICEVVARLHGGSITARNEAGAVFEMVFPMPAPAPMPEEWPT
ncbi:sensor histidine kinase, partial [Cutibacterium acnes]